MTDPLNGKYLGMPTEAEWRAAQEKIAALTAGQPLAWMIESDDPAMALQPTRSALVAYIWRRSGLNVRALFASQAAADASVVTSADRPTVGGEK